MFGHQFVAHLNSQLGKAGKISSIANSVDGHGVPLPHFGAVMNFNDWEVFAQKVSRCMDEFITKPQVRFEVEVESKYDVLFWSLR